jgi:hypothetical protein
MYVQVPHKPQGISGKAFVKNQPTKVLNIFWKLRFPKPIPTIIERGDRRCINNLKNQ